MSESKNHFVFEFLALLCCISFQNVSGIEVELIRLQRGDRFENPYSTSPENVDFCLSTNAKFGLRKCPKRRGPGKCRYCICNKMKTFNETSLRCTPSRDFGQGCRTTLSDDSLFLKLLDLTENGDTTLYIDSYDDVKSVHLISMNGMGVDFFTLKGEPDKDDGRWEVDIEWKGIRDMKYRGQLFKVQISYDIVHNGHLGKRNDCFVFKSKGRKTVKFPNSVTTTTLLPSTTPLPSTTKKSSSTQTSPSGVVISDSVTTTASTTTEYVTTTAQPTTKAGLILTTGSTTDSVKTTVSASEISTAAVSSSDQTKPSKVTRKPTSSASETEMSKFTPTNDTKKERRSGKENDGNNAVTVSLTVVGCLLLLGVVVLLAVLWLRRRSSRTSKDKTNTEFSFANGNVENPTVMSQPENIYAEAESTIYCPKNGEDNYEYDYADGNLKNYASLDITKVENKPVYQSLINVERDLNEHIPSDGGKTSTAEPFYQVVEGQTKGASEIYHVLEESEEAESREKPGRTGHDSPERVYSTLEENAPENCDRDVLGRTGEDNPERVFSVLENEANLPASDTH